ncbi:ATP-dependent helicase/nuclease subunit A [Halalkaliarchaeum desulfuricum]|uniref:ATP-dependent helicase/nuclease subunit A n=1 Tax=Halalkaliarchaeum desulfuricum TaxID=2055893 RepID=A0A343TLB3_9EURY|nr:PD-(D/E)XK nuclease family protein [Halalkaliarchaeum desulfuricum]AUX09885.1 ATP-dependent helicase/nuclease subunit A [Halalkaliarchaeum desulfuricum]
MIKTTLPSDRRISRLVGGTLVVSLAYVLGQLLGGSAAGAVGFQLPPVDDATGAFWSLGASAILIGLTITLASWWFIGTRLWHLLTWFALVFFGTVGIILEGMFFFPGALPAETVPGVVLAQFVAAIVTATVAAVVLGPTGDRQTSPTLAMPYTSALLLLSGLHEANEEQESGLKAGKPPAEAKHRTDWLQPLLLADDSLLEDLSTSSSVQRSLGTADYTVHRPPAGAAWRSVTSPQRPPTDIEIDEPPSTQPKVRLTATEFRDYVYEVRHDGASKPATPDSSDADETTEAENQQTGMSLDPRVFGDIVHKLCELRLPEGDWPDTIRRLAPDPAAITDETVALIAQHVHAGLAEFEQLQSTYPVDQRFDEVQVTARFSAGRVIGDIDHLSITPTGYHVVDYKTSDLAGRAVETLTEYYLPQLRVYACALYQADPGLESVDLRLVFTDEGITERVQLGPSEIEADIDRYDSLLQQR